MLGDTDIRRIIFYSKNVPFGDIGTEVESIKFNKGLYLQFLDTYINASLPAGSKSMLDSLKSNRNDTSKTKRKFVTKMSHWRYFGSE